MSFLKETSPKNRSEPQKRLQLTYTLYIIAKKVIEETLELLENLLLHRRVRFEVVRSLHLFERALFLFIERFRHIDTDVDE